ncbi:hypothetical protein D918_03771 [Trichuris suis]|nr:hypothetical protein D918_03771 [Trichuris suis]
MDGFSLMMFKHEMKKTYRYITDTLNGIVYYSFAMTDRNSTLSTLLTGELGEDSPASAGNSSTNFPLPLLWNYMQEQNYTMMFDGGAEMTNEVWDIFLSSPGYEQFEHGMTAFRFGVNEELNRGANRHCFGSVSEHNVQFSYAQEFFTSYSKGKPKFAFQFLPISSSNAETYLPEHADEDMAKHLTFLNDNGILEDTMTIILSSRGSKRRQSGKNGEATMDQYKPLLVVILPSKPATINSGHAVNYRINSWSLVTPADVYITLLTLPIVNERKHLQSLLKNYSAKGTPLFQELPIQRTCAKAGVAKDLCPCLNWIRLSNATNLASLMAKTIVLAINRKTAHERELCAFIQLKEIIGITIGSSNGFNHSADEIIRFWSESDDPIERYEVFQITIATKPGDAIYKAWIILDKKDSLLHVDLKNVYRLNAYGLNPECIVTKNTSLIDWCVCYDKVNS